MRTVLLPVMLLPVMLLTVMLLSASAQAGTSRHIVVESTVDALGGIRFEGASARITVESQRQLAFAAACLVDNPQLERIEVKAAHLGAPAALARERAESVRSYLREHGVEDLRLSTRVAAGADNDVELILL